MCPTPGRTWKMAPGDPKKAAGWPNYPHFWALKTWYSNSPTPKMGGKVTLIAYKTTCSSFYARKARIFELLGGLRKIPGNLARDPRRWPVHPASLRVGGPGLFLWMPRPHKPRVRTRFRDSILFWKAPSGWTYFLSTLLYTSLRFAGEGAHTPPRTPPPAFITRLKTSNNDQYRSKTCQNNEKNMFFEVPGLMNEFSGRFLKCRFLAPKRHFPLLQPQKESKKALFNVFLT